MLCDDVEVRKLQPKVFMSHQKFPYTPVIDTVAAALRYHPHRCKYTLVLLLALSAERSPDCFFRRHACPTLQIACVIKRDEAFSALSGDYTCRSPTHSGAADEATSHIILGR